MLQSLGKPLQIWGISNLAVVLDLFSRRVVGWAMAARQDETLIYEQLMCSP